MHCYYKEKFKVDHSFPLPSLFSYVIIEVDGSTRLDQRENRLLLWHYRTKIFEDNFALLFCRLIDGFCVCLIFLGTAYGKTLRRYHGWVVRGVFAVSA